MTMIASPEPRHRTRTEQLRPFWTANAARRHDPDDGLLRHREWDDLGLEFATTSALIRAGFTCYRLVPACPDWLLLSIPGLGPTRLAEVRRILPYDRAVHASRPCPGAVLEAERRARPPVARGAL